MNTYTSEEQVQKAGMKWAAYTGPDIYIATKNRDEFLAWLAERGYRGQRGIDVLANYEVKKPAKETALDAHNAAVSRLRRAQDRLTASLRGHDSAWLMSDKKSYGYAGDINHVAELIEQAAEFIGQ